MRVASFYRVDTDVDRYQFLLTDEEESYYFDGTPYRDSWRPPPVYSYKPKLVEPDFWDFGLGACGRAWAIRPEAFSTAPELEATLGYSGEMLPLPFGGREFTLFNITECIDALDENKTEWDRYNDGSRAGVEVPVFRLDRLGANVFKVPVDSSMRVYYWEDSEDWTTQLRAIVEREDLTGLEFTFLYDTPWAE